jgi:5-methylthioribose kinase
MSRFEKHFRMRENDIIEYVKEKLDFFLDDEKLICSEIGDGNINYVFRVLGIDSGKSLVVKHADIADRSCGDPLDVDRNRIEANALIQQGLNCPAMVPAVHLFDPVMSCLVMEDLSDHKILRSELIEYKTFQGLGSDLSEFLVDTLLPATDLLMDPMVKKNMVKEYINPELCEISERLVFTEPYLNGRGKNTLTALESSYAEDELYSDNLLHLEAAKLKLDFLTNAQTLIHGDLHTGSIFIKPGSVKVIDPEFAFFGPMGYDVGNVIANLFFPLIRATVDIEDSGQKDIFRYWVEDTIKELVDEFIIRFDVKLKLGAKEPFAQDPEIREWYLEDVLKDASGFAGLELIRRIVGAAKVRDITSIKDDSSRARAEQIGIVLGKELIFNRESITNGEAYILAFRRALSR